MKHKSKLCRAVSGSFLMVLAASAASAQQSGSTPTETITTARKRDLNGVDQVSERVVTRTTQSTVGEEVVIETYAPAVYAYRLELSQRVRRVTTVTSDGSQTVEETEEPPRGSPHEPLRVVRRSVTTVRRSGPDAQETEQRVFERDLNDRLVPKETHVERTSRK